MDHSGGINEHVFSIQRIIPDAFQAYQRLGLRLHPIKKVQDHLEIKLFQEKLFSILSRQKRFQLFWNSESDYISKTFHLKKNDRQSGKNIADASLLGHYYFTRNGIEIIFRIVDVKSSALIAIKDVFVSNKEPEKAQTLSLEMSDKINMTFPLMEGECHINGDHLFIRPFRWMPRKGRVKTKRQLVVFQRFKEQFNPMTDKSFGYNTKILGLTHVDKRFHNGQYRAPKIDIDQSWKMNGVITR